VASDSTALVTSLNSGLNELGLTPCTGVIVTAPVVEAPPPVNLTAVDVSQAVAAVDTAFANLSPANAEALQTQMLDSLLTGTNGTELSPAAATAAASLVLAVVSAAPGVTLSLASQAAALDILSSITGSGINATGAVGQTIASALDSVASSAISSNPAALAQVQNVLTSLASSQATSLLASLASLVPGAPPPAPATTSTPMIQTSVQVDPPGSDRLTTQPISAPGSASGFQPMPADLLPTTVPLVTTFLSLKFDPNQNPNTTGMTRLAFSNADGSEVPVANAAKPILFTLPAVNLTNDQAVCSYWDTVALEYATNGCIGVPNPYPRYHTVAFNSNYSTPDDASLASAWNISGPMVDGGLCNFRVLDCNLESPGVVFPDPRNPLDPASRPVACPPRPNATNATDGTNVTIPRQPVLRVYYGTSCLLWRPDNGYGCHWDNLLQAFQGSGCTRSTSPTQCMCRHLTDFASARVPKIETCSLQDSACPRYDGSPARADLRTPSIPQC
jgi:hypothetical protein